MSWMAQFLRNPGSSRGVESPQQSLQGMDHGLAANGLAVAGKLPGFRVGLVATPTPGKAYGAHWLTR